MLSFNHYTTHKPYTYVFHDWKCEEDQLLLQRKPVLCENKNSEHLK